MNKRNKHNSHNEIVTFFTKHYKSPTKAFIWGKVISEWGRIIFGGIIFVVVALIIFVPLLVGHLKDQTIMNRATRYVATHLKEIVEFADIGKHSMEQRNAILAELVQTINKSDGLSFDQKSTDEKLHKLTSILKNCKYERRTSLENFSKSKNPHMNPEVSESFEKLIGKGSSLGEDQPSPISFEEENKEWGKLCALCEVEMKKAQDEHRQMLNAQANISGSNSLEN